MPRRTLPVIEPELLPPRLAGWAANMLGGPIPREEHATCSACAMVTAEGDEPSREDESFHPGTKCCTYLPELSNFSVGAILRPDGATAFGQDSVRRRIADRLNVTPLGVGQPPRHLDPRGDPPVFGRDLALLCSHYADGCSVWAHRDSVCATYYCKFGRGEIGQRFWATLRAALTAAERAVSRGCMLSLGISPSALATLRCFRAAAARVPTLTMDDRTYGKVWEGWAGKEEAFFLECADAADQVTWEDVLGWGGVDFAIAVQSARHDYAALSNVSLPKAPSGRPIRIYPAGPDHTRVIAYSDTDPIMLPVAVVSALGHFDGRPLAAARSAASDRERVELSDELVRTLADFGVISDGDD